MNEEIIYRFIHKYSPEQGIEKFRDVLINECCFNVYVNDNLYKKICCTPSNLDEMLIGYLAMEGLIFSSSDIKSMEFKKDRINVSLSVEPREHDDMEKGSDISCPAVKLIRLMQAHLKSSDLHKLTGGVHVMSLADQEGLLVSREDIGRHNAVDKLYGYCLLNGVNCSDKIFLSSGRVTHEIMQKLLFMGIKLVVSRAAVTSLAQEIAEQHEVTVLGFARGERFNIYTHPSRVLS